MIANYHTHTVRCGHAQGSEREYVENAIKSGLKVLGFADHGPMPFEEMYYSGFRMRIKDLDDYCSVLTSLREEYKNDIDIHIGLEEEYYPKYFDKLFAICSDYPIEYLILGQHFTQNEYDGHLSSSAEDSEDILNEYVDQVCEAVETGKYLYIAHPDVIHYVGSGKIYDLHMSRLIETAEKTHTPIEINLLGISNKRHYPDDRFWALCRGRKVKVILGSDAHAPEDVVRPEAEKEALNIIKKYGLDLIDSIEIGVIE